MTGVTLNIDDVVRKDKLKCLKVDDVEKVGAGDSKSDASDALEISCYKVNVRCKTFV